MPYPSVSADRRWTKTIRPRAVHARGRQTPYRHSKRRSHRGCFRHETPNGRFAFAQAFASGLVILGGIRPEKRTEPTPGARDRSLQRFDRIIALIDEPLQLKSSGLDCLTQQCGSGLEITKTLLCDVIQRKRGIGIPRFDDFLRIQKDGVDCG